MTTCVLLDATNASYHGGAGINKGLLDVVARSPLHAKALLDTANDNLREPTPAQIIGTALHTLVLEPHKFACEYVCELTRDDAPHAIDDRDQLVAMVQELNADRLPKLSASGANPELMDRLLAAYAEQGVDARADLDGMKGSDLKAEIKALNETRPGLLNISGNRHELAAILAEHGRPVVLWSDVRARWDAENEGMTVLSVETYEQLLGMAHSIASHPAANALLTGEGVAEASVYWTDEATGELCRCRPDYWRRDGVLVDLKSTIDASPEGFAKSIANYRYHVQAPWYLEGAQAAHDAGHGLEGYARPRAFAFVAVEKSHPFAVGVYVLDPDSLEIGAKLMRENLDTLAECKRTGVWPGYGDTLQQIGVPQYYLRNHAHLLGAA